MKPILTITPGLLTTEKMEELTEAGVVVLEMPDSEKAQLTAIDDAAVPYKDILRAAMESMVEHRNDGYHCRRLFAEKMLALVTDRTKQPK